MSALVSEATSAAWPDGARFALYYAPARDSAWWRAGCAWLGRDAESGEAVAAPDVPGLARPLADLTVAPRRYGWHGTLIAPFKLGPDVTPEILVQAVARWANTQTRFSTLVEAATLKHFVALRPVDDSGVNALRALASDALATLGSLRAAPDAAELARRLEAPLTTRQRALLEQWGYPYVFDEFRFHMTLSDSLDAPAEREALRAAWATQMQPPGSLPVDSVALFVEPAPRAPFVLWRRFGLGPQPGAAAR